ncbi:MAG: T9SS type A sorting domain-containing protein [Saprospiraceae bacterium]|nr:T9SS type A sorting domain-containing protein [Saprospiraceae bacterium]
MKVFLVCFLFFLSIVPNAVFAQVIDLTKGTWLIKEIIMTDGKSERSPYYRMDDPKNLIDFSKITYVFNKDGTVTGHDLQGENTPPEPWKLVGNKLTMSDIVWNLNIINENEIMFMDEFDPIISSSLNKTENFLIRVNTTGSHDEYEVEKVVITPMPVHSGSNININFNSNVPGEVRIKIRDLTGKVVQTYKSQPINGIVDILIPNISSGNYIMSIIQNNKEILKKIQVISD